MAAEMSSQTAPLPNATAVGTLAPVTMPAFSNDYTDNDYTGPLFPQSVSNRQPEFVDILLTYLVTLQDLAIPGTPRK